jgi:putative tryptophan/tyrosine transport system substrate-binding protein
MKLSKHIFVAFCFFLSVSSLTGCGNSGKKKMYRIGIFSGLNIFSEIDDGFKSKMKELGYIENKNIVYDIQKVDSETEEARRTAQKFVADKVDIILSYPTQTSILAKNVAQNTGVPVLFCNANIEGTNLVKSLREPGGNITGVRFPGPDIAARRLEILHDIVPDAKRIWIPYDKDYVIVPSQLEVLRKAASSLGLTLVEVPCVTVGDLKKAIAKRESSKDLGIDAIMFFPERLTGRIEAFDAITKFGADHKLVVGGHTVAGRENNTVFGLSPRNFAVGEQAAYIADKILKGTPAGYIPVVTSENFFTIDTKAAKKVGVELSSSLLSSADLILR